jgi:hypothetical protein
MTTTLPTLTRTIDNAFTHTWYQIKADAIDNITDANVLWAAFKAAGCLKSKVGGEYVTETISYDVETAEATEKGKVLPQGEKEYETMAMWTWRYIVSKVQRSLFDDQKNNGPDKIKSLVNTRLTKARESLTTKFEASLAAAQVTDESGIEMLGINDVLPTYANRATGTHGKIARSNTWWQSKYKLMTLPVEVNLYSDMKNLYNTISNNMTPPNLIVCNQTIFEVYEDFIDDKAQLVTDMGTRLADLGFDVLKFKGKSMVWTDAVKNPTTSTDQLLMLNTDHLTITYDPQLWFDMTDWKAAPTSADRLAHIFCAATGLWTNEPRRHGRLYNVT